MQISKSVLYSPLLTRLVLEWAWDPTVYERFPRASRNVPSHLREGTEKLLLFSFECPDNIWMLSLQL